jgi:hypothetical protein
LLPEVKSTPLEVRHSAIYEEKCRLVETMNNDFPIQREPSVRVGTGVMRSRRVGIQRSEFQHQGELVAGISELRNPEEVGQCGSARDSGGHVAL